MQHAQHIGRVPGGRVGRDGRKPLFQPRDGRRKHRRRCEQVERRREAHAVPEPGHQGTHRFGRRQRDDGSIGCGVILPAGVKAFDVIDKQQLSLGTAQPGQPFVYYFGAGWSKSGDFADAAAWDAYVRGYVGQPQEAVLAHYGPPTQVLDDGRGGKIWVFTTVNASVTPARDETTFDAQNHVRTTMHYPEQRVESKVQRMFWVKDGKIYNATYRED